MALTFPWLSLLRAKHKECGGNMLSRFGEKKKKKTVPPNLVCLCQLANVSLFVGVPTPPLSACFLVKHSRSALLSRLLCSFLFLVSIPASLSDITFSLKIGSESYFCLLSRDLSSQTPTGCKNEFKTNPEEERKKLA